MIPDLMFLAKVVVIALAFYGFMRIATSRSYTEKAAALMWSLEREPNGLSGAELHKITGVSIGSVHVYMGRLERQKLVSIRFDPMSRQYRYHLVRETAQKLHDEWRRENA